MLLVARILRKMSSLNRLFVCLRCTTSRLNVLDVVVKKTKFSLWGNLLVSSRAKCTASLPLFTRALGSQCVSSQPFIRGYRTAPTGTTGFAQNIYDEHEVCIMVLSGSVPFLSCLLYDTNWPVLINDTCNTNTRRAAVSSVLWMISICRNFMSVMCS